LEGEPIILAAPEGEKACTEMSVWEDIRLIPDFACVTVPDKIEYPKANYSDFKLVFDEIKEKTNLNKLGIVGIDAMSKYVFDTIRNSVGNVEITDANSLLFELRLTKSENEIKCLKEAARIADEGYKALMNEAAIGKTELDLEAAAYNAAKRAGAESIPFCLVSSGKRVDTIIGRATNKIIEDGDMVMAALAVQYEGYIATVNFPFVVGNISDGQKKLINLLVEAEGIALEHLKPNSKQSDLVIAVKGYFAKNNVSEYDLYPPLHGCGMAEAESPYPNENTVGIFKPGMTVNIDLSLFGHPDGSNRIEEGFLVTENGYEPMSNLVRNLISSFLKKLKIVYVKRFSFSPYILS
jgi:Xaa-Pro aminopeptidase